MPADPGPAHGLDPERRDAASGGAPVRVRRLKKRREFLAVADARVKWSTPGLVLQARPVAAEAVPEQPGSVGVGFTVSKKVGNAVARNRARRRLRAAAALVMPRAAKPGTDYVLIGRRETIDRPFRDLVADLETSLARVSRPRRGSRPGGRP
jgi:ribonuclease P protein component